MPLRPYQRDIANDTVRSLRKYRSVMVQSSTGSGKTVVIVELINYFLSQGDSSMVIAHREELINQTAYKLRDKGLDVGVIMAGIMNDYSRPVQVASVQTLIRRQMPKGIKYIIVDEAHHILAASYKTIIANYPDAKIIGFTATPIRTNGAGFDDIFEHLIVGPQPQELIKQGFLLQPKYFAAPLRADLSSVKKTAGDYNEKALAAVMDKTSLTGDVVKEWHHRAYGKKTITFAVSIEHSKHIVERYKQAGIPAAHLDGGTPKEVRSRLFAEFTRGDITVLSNVGIATEGTDIPAIECVQMVRPTQSLSLYLQMGGRGLRPFQDQEHCIVLDHSNNIFAHGFLEQDRDWSLKGVRKFNGERAFNDRKIMAVYQGKLFFAHELPDEASDIQLIEMDYNATRMNDLNRFIADADRRGRKRYSAYYEFRKRYTPTPLELIKFQEMLGVKKGWASHAMRDCGYSAEKIKELSSVIYS